MHGGLVPHGGRDHMLKTRLKRDTHHLFRGSFSKGAVRERSLTRYACLYNREIYDFDTLSDFFRIFYLCGEKLSISCDYIIKIGNDT